MVFEKKLRQLAEDAERHEQERLSRLREEYPNSEAYGQELTEEEFRAKVAERLERLAAAVCREFG